MASKIQLRRDTRENWESVNPVLSQGEPGLQLAENLIKIGDGVTAWNDLGYYNYLDTGSYAKLVGDNYFIGDNTIEGTLFVSSSTTQVIAAKGTKQGFVEINVKNGSSLNAASADLVATNNLDYYVDLGINSSTFNTFLGGNNDAYLYNTGSDFLIGNITRGGASLKFFSGNDGTVFPLIVSGSEVFINGDLVLNGTSYVAQTSGTSGTSGTGGTSGTRGTAGSGGSSGTSGTAGSSGTAGTSGTSGTDGVSDRYKTTSTTSFTLGSGGTIFVEAGLAYTTAQDIIITYDISNHQTSTVISYNTSTGELVFSTPSHTVGSGTYTSWTVNLAGAAGGNGTSGTSGINGTAGSGGTSGTNGTAGSGGTSGIDGTSGSGGSSGSGGTSGSGGSSGTSGANGTNGLDGTSGINGSSGTSGSGGSSGTRGSAGTSGTSGSSGLSGTSGLDGTSGSSGTRGTSGSGGTSGTSGIDGTSGTSGLDGSKYQATSDTEFTLGSGGTIFVETGLSYTVAQDVLIAYDGSNHQVSTIISYNSSTGELVFGTPSEVTGSGTYSAWTVNLAGAAGGDGTSGSSGSSGTSGSSGISGSSGTSGQNGINGLDGTSGSGGSSGTSGTRGTAGSSGTSGLSGTSGSSGVSGTSGTSGSGGSSGTSAILTAYTGSAVISGSLTVTGSFNINDGFYVSGSRQFNYAMMYHTASQTIASSTTAYEFEFSTMDGNSGAFEIVRSGTRTSRIYTNVTGWYNVQYTAQAYRSSTGASDVNLWLRKDGNDVPATNNRVQLDYLQDVIITKSNLLYLNSGSYFEIMYQGEGTANSFPYYGAGTTPTTPVTPSITCVITQHG